MYDEIWTAGKAMYKLEPVLADGGELIIYAPHVREVCCDASGNHHGDWISLPRLLPQTMGVHSSITLGVFSRIPLTCTGSARSKTAWNRLVRM